MIPSGVDRTRFLLMAVVVAEAIQELKAVPSGSLYAGVMSHMDIHTYEAILALLLEVRLIRRRSHELFWIGSAEAVKPEALMKVPT